MVRSLTNTKDPPTPLAGRVSRSSEATATLPFDWTLGLTFGLLVIRSGVHLPAVPGHDAGGLEESDFGLMG